jgi:hypothetical protein
LIVSGIEPARWPAYATECRRPIDRTEALRLVGEYLHLTDELPGGGTLHVDDWGSCFTVAVFRPSPPVGPDGVPQQPTEVGGGVTVLDKETGHFSFWPSWGTRNVAQRFAEAKEADAIEYLDEWPESNV